MESGQHDGEVREINLLYDSIIKALILKGAGKKVIDKTWHEIGYNVLRCTAYPRKIDVDYMLKDLRQRYNSLQLADEEQVSQMDIFLPDYKKPEEGHLFFEEGGLRNVDEYTIGKIR